jgi:hypothetical protein
MPEGLQETVINEILRPVIAYFSGREDRNTLEHAGKLHFWSDGMLHELKQIRDEKATEETFESLHRKYKGIQVWKEMQKLKLARDKLGGGPLANAIDECLAADGYGKGIILMSIADLCDYHPDQKENARMAKVICNEIEALNAALDRLRRLIEA